MSWTAATCVFPGACSQEEPPSRAEDSFHEGPSIDERVSHFPLVDGASWQYVGRTASGQWSAPRTSSLRDAGEGRFVRVDGQNDRVETTYARHGQQVRTLSQRRFAGETELSTTVYGEVGRVVLDEAWLENANRDDHVEYLHEEYAGTGELTRREWRVYRYEVRSSFEPVTVPAGSFGCVRIRRTRIVGTSSGPVQETWFARGVGLVQWLDPDAGQLEVLAAVDVPGGVEAP
ncbi:MAG: hypothetical protein B7733_01070 [Myxococcales bacterium FL481]|nr:MAG: hypothetical protein B7733_01070 [Myxococcales bacterium FL481]